MQFVIQDRDMSSLALARNPRIVYQRERCALDNRRRNGSAEVITAWMACVASGMRDENHARMTTKTLAERRVNQFTQMGQEGH
jgi:hypothetical protein